MNASASTNAMVARMNEIDRQLCSDFGIFRTADAKTLDEAIAMAAVTTDRLLAGERLGDGEHAGGYPLHAFLLAQIEARELRAGCRTSVVRSLTDGIRRMKKAGSLQGLVRQACTELREVFGFDNAAVSFIEDKGFVVEESGHHLGGPTVVPRRECVAERDCIRLRDTIRTNGADIPPTETYRELMGSADYLVAPVIAEAKVVALLHVSRNAPTGVCDADVDVLDAFSSAYSLVHEKMLNAERVQHQRTSIARAAARLTEEADRIAAAAISLDIGDAEEMPVSSGPVDSALMSSLSAREREVFERLILGASNADIAEGLVITVETVKTHVKRILRKIGAINRSEAIALYLDETRTSHRRRGV